MSAIDFKTHIENIRKEALELGYSITTMDGYLGIWNKFINWKNETNFIYNDKDYAKFLLEHYNFNVDTYTNKSKSRDQQLMRSKRMLDNFDIYKKDKEAEILPQELFKEYPNNWNIVLDNYSNYLKDVRCNADNSIKLYKNYLIRLLSYFYQNKINNLNEITKETIISFINYSVNSGQVSKRRYFHVLSNFLKYLFMEDYIDTDLSIYIPKIKSVQKKKLPTILKQTEIDNLLNTISKETNTGIRDYAIVLIAARLGLRIIDILNIKIKDIDWKNNKITVLQTKNNNLNILPLSKELGWAIINYLKIRPKCNNEYLFIKSIYPYEKMEQFTQYNKYFEKINIEVNSSKAHGIHTLRHSLATKMIENEIPINIIAEILGNSTEVCSNTYLKLDKKNLKACALEVEDYE